MYDFDTLKQAPKEFIEKCPVCGRNAYIIPPMWYVDEWPEKFDPNLLNVFKSVQEHQGYYEGDDYLYCPHCRRVYVKHSWFEWQEMCEIFLQF